jgi:hypothetical protein
MLEHSRNLRQKPSSLKSYGVVTVDTAVPALVCGGGPDVDTAVPALVCDGGPDVDTAVPALVCGGGPDERNEVNLFSKSNQNGAPRDTANIVASNPTIFNIQFDQSVGTLELDHPITS